MMDYEKAYKAVLQTATQWIKDGCTDKEKICLESVFPELRESEDEKIRKEQMMKKTIEYEVGMHGEPITINLDKYVQRARGIFPGDKVRIIILPKED